MASDGNYWSGQINFAGLGNGTDFGKMIDGLIKTEGFHKRRLEAWKKGWQDKSKELLALNSKVLGLQTTLKKMDTVGELLGKTTSSADGTVVSATANGDAAFGAHKIEVKQLATTDHWTSTGAGFDKMDSKVTASNAAASFKFSYAGKTVDINVPGGTNLTQFISNINNHKDLRGKVRASAVSDGNSFFLQLKGLELGGDNKIVMSNSSIPGLGAGSFSNIQQAQDALLKVDGFPPGSAKWMSRSTNSISDAIEGVTLNLKSAKPGSTIDVTVSHDQEATKKTVSDFLKALNEVRLQIKKLTEVTKGTANAEKTKKSGPSVGSAKGSILTGNYGVEMVSQKLKMVIASPGMGFELSGKDTDIYSSLAMVGITTDANKGSASFRQLKLDAKVFDKALKADPKAVAALFVTDHSVSTQSTDFTPGSIIKGVTPPGKHHVAYEVQGGKIVSATIDGEKAKISGWEVTGVSGKKGAGLSFNVTNQVNGKYSGQINIRLGKIHELLDDVKELTNPTSGTLKIIEKNYSSIITNIDKKIEREAKRIGDKRRRLKNRYARLDATLGRYDKLQESLKGQIAKLGK